MINPLRDIVCPYCLNHMKVFELVHACSVDSSHRRSGKRVADFLALGGKCREPNCPGQYTRLLCPQNGDELPGNIAEYDGYSRLAITAPSGGGKTVLITTMLHEMFAHSMQLGLNIGAMDSKTSQYYRKHFGELYEHHEAPEGNPRGYVPMQWYVQNTRRSSQNVTPTYSLTIFDGAGESQSNPSDAETRYIAEAKMLMLLIDPLKLYGIRKQLTDDEIRKGGGDPVKDQVDDRYTADFIDQLVSYIRVASRKTVRERLKIPVAVVLCKMDLLQRFFPAESVVYNPPPMTFGTFNDVDSQQVHAEIDAFIHSACPSLNMSFNMVFSNWRYFGVSSYGAQPLGKQKLAEAPRPLRVMDPLMWNLRAAGIL